MVTGILKEPVSSIYYPEYGGSRCLLFYSWGGVKLNYLVLHLWKSLLYQPQMTNMDQ